MTRRTYPEVFVVCMPAVQLILQHSNVDYRLGPFRPVLAIGPTHRLHHVNWEGEGDVNFGLFFTFWDAGAWTVEPVELHRVFPIAQATPKAVPQHAQTDALVAELRAQLAEMRSQRDAWQGIAERLALSAPKLPEPEPAKPQS